MKFLNEDFFLKDTLTQLRARFAGSEPFPHVVFDGLFGPEVTLDNGLRNAVDGPTFIEALERISGIDGLVSIPQEPVIPQNGVWTQTTQVGKLYTVLQVLLCVGAEDDTGEIELWHPSLECVAPYDYKRGRAVIALAGDMTPTRTEGYIEHVHYYLKAPPPWFKGPSLATQVEVPSEA